MGKYLNKRTIVGTCLFSCVLILMIPHISAIEYHTAIDINKERVESIYNGFKDISTYSIFKIILMILLIIDIPIAVFSVVISIICYIIYLPVQSIAYLYQNYFWDYDPFFITPMFLVYQLFGFLLQIIGSPIIFITGTLQYIRDSEDKEYYEYIQSVKREYVKFIHDLLVLFFPPDLPNC